MTDDDFIFFWGGILSNFHPIEGDENFTSEKIYMAAKAIAFRDSVSLTDIVDAKTPRAAKKLGRGIEGFDESVWGSIKIPSMMLALEIKFSACREFADFLGSTKGKVLVEASPTDRIWGIGFTEKDALANFDKWGENLLGKCLMRLRHKKFGF